MYFPNDIWLLIKSFQYHNIKIHGKHLKNDPSVTSYNCVVKDIPTPKILPVGPCIVYCSQYKRPRLVKFIYCLPVFRQNAYKLVIEYTQVIYYERYMVDNNISMSTDEYISSVYKTQYPD
jgi:hypothetical protein